MLGLKVMRIKRQMSQEDLAGLMGVNQTTVSLWEQGKSSPSLLKLKRLAEILNCTVNDLIEE